MRSVFQLHNNTRHVRLSKVTQHSNITPTVIIGVTAVSAVRPNPPTLITVRTADAVSPAGTTTARGQQVGGCVNV